MERTASLPIPQPAFLGALAALGLFAFYLVGLDQGLLLSVVQGNAAFDMNLVHEFLHDARHAAGFPCH